MLKLDSQTDELESIISLSAAPLVDLSLVIDNIKDHVSYYQNLPSIAKPFLKRDIPGPEYIVNEIIGKHKLICIAGDTGIGKTMLSIQLGLSIALGVKEFHNRDCHDQQELTI